MSAVKEAGNLGSDADFARTYTASEAGTARLYTCVSETMACMRKLAFDCRRRDESCRKAMDALDEAGEKK